MTPLPVELVKLPHGETLNLPFYATVGSAGMDLLTAINDSITLKPLDRALIPCGFLFSPSPRL